MLIENVIIRINKKDKYNKPIFKITIYGNGKIIFNGIKKVKKLGITESKIKDKEFIGIIEQFKKSNFIKLKNSYITDKENKDELVEITISIPQENDRIFDKTIIFNLYDSLTPDSLLKLYRDIIKKSKLENKISEREDNSKKVIKNSKVKKITALILITIILVAGIFYIYFEIDMNKDLNSLESKIFPPKIDIFTISDGIQSNINNPIKNNYNITDELFIYLEYSEIFVNEKNRCDVDLSLNIKDEMNEIVFNDIIKKNIVNNSYSWNIALNNSWRSGNYSAQLKIKDNYVNKTVSEINYFIINNISPKIIEFETASIIYQNNNYDSNFLFKKNDIIYIYLEIEKDTINTIDNYDFRILLNVSCNDIVYYESFKNNVEKNKFNWSIESNDNWPVDELYSVNLIIQDKDENIVTSDNIYFWIST